MAPYRKMVPRYMSQFKLFTEPLSASALLGEAGVCQDDSSERGYGTGKREQPVSPKGAIVTCMCGWSKTYVNTWVASWGAITHQRFCPLVLEGLSWLSHKS